MGGYLRWWRVGKVMEASAFDPYFGRVMTPNLADYHFPVNADIHGIRVSFIDKPDPHFGPLGARGLEREARRLGGLESPGARRVEREVGEPRLPLPEGELEVADRLVILANGRIILDAPRGTLGGDEIHRLYALHTEEAS